MKTIINSTHELDVEVKLNLIHTLFRLGLIPGDDWYYVMQVRARFSRI
jgi:hypothetical protein